MSFHEFSYNVATYANVIAQHLIKIKYHELYLHVDKVKTINFAHSKIE